MSEAVQIFPRFCHLAPLCSLSVEYFPQVGYLLALHRKDGFATDQDDVRVGQDQGWTYQVRSLPTCAGNIVT